MGSIWMVINERRCYYVLSSVLLCTTLTSSHRSHTPFVHFLAKLTNTGLKAVKLDPCRSGKDNFQWLWANILNKHMESKNISHHSMFHLYYAHHAMLVSDWVGLFSSSSAAGTNGCLDLSFHSCPPSGDLFLNLCAVAQ